MPAFGAGRRRRLPPLDESNTDPSFLSLRTQLLIAIERKDEKLLLACLDPKIRTDFGGGGGHDGVRKAWKLGKPGSKLWDELGEVMRLGAVKYDTGFAAPYVFGRWPEDLDSFEHVAAIRKDAVLRTAPKADAPVVERLSWDILRVDQLAKSGWQRASLLDGKSGYVRENDVRSPVAYRALFNKVKGRWTMTAFVAGD